MLAEIIQYGLGTAGAVLFVVFLWYWGKATGRAEHQAEINERLLEHDATAQTIDTLTHDDLVRILQDKLPNK